MMLPGAMPGVCVFAEGGARLEAARAISITRLNTLRRLHL